MDEYTWHSKDMNPRASMAKISEKFNIFQCFETVKVLGQVVWNKSNSSARQVNSDAVYSETTGISW